MELDLHPEPYALGCLGNAGFSSAASAVGRESTRE